MKLSKVEKKKIEAFVHSKAKKYLAILGTPDLDINVFYRPEVSDSMSDGVADNVSASIETTHPYQFCKLWLYKPFFDEWEKKDYEYCEEIIRHEIAHTLTSKVKSLAFDRFTTTKEINEADEYVTTTVERLLSKIADV